MNGCDHFLNGPSEDRTTHVEAILRFGVDSGSIDREGLLFLSVAQSIEGFPFRGTVECIAFERMLLETLSDKSVDWQWIRRLSSNMLRVLEGEVVESGQNKVKTEEFLSIRPVSSALLPKYTFGETVVAIEGRPVVFYHSETVSSGFQFDSMDIMNGRKAGFSGRVFFNGPNFDFNSRIFAIRRAGEIYLVASATNLSAQSDAEDRYCLVMFPLKNPSAAKVYFSKNKLSTALEPRIHIHFDEKRQEESLVFLSSRVEVHEQSNTLVFDPWGEKEPVVELESADVVLSLDDQKLMGVRLDGNELSPSEESSFFYWIHSRSQLGGSDYSERRMVQLPVPAGLRDSWVTLDPKSIASVGKGNHQKVVWMGRLEGNGKTGWVNRSVLYIFDVFTKKIQMKMLPNSMTLLGRAGSLSGDEEGRVGWIVVNSKQTSVRLLDFDGAGNRLKQHVLRKIPQRERGGVIDIKLEDVVETPVYFRALGRVYAICPIRNSLGRMDGARGREVVQFNVVDLSTGDTIQRLEVPGINWERFGTKYQVLRIRHVDESPVLTVYSSSSKNRGRWGGFPEYILFEFVSKGDLR